ncbi:hypothetical protein [Brevibacillus thermoruber]|jgi:hypothetical protein|uniref:Uncharacterized protein n=1 Tax=Brevibacillus thermoruber TaxID=33942 RepID=A0A9X3Z2Y8_9BACL|nr:hypothetical protein [Brevibacillus thermoruber]MDA5108301.1 hypothetical protein [Brevibacillus thermoruber]
METYDFNIAKKLLPEIITGLKQKIEGFMIDSIKEVAAQIDFAAVLLLRFRDRIASPCSSLTSNHPRFASTRLRSSSSTISPCDWQPSNPGMFRNRTGQIP